MGMFSPVFFLIDLIAQRAGMALTTDIKQVIALQEEEKSPNENLATSYSALFSAG